MFGGWSDHPSEYTSCLQDDKNAFDLLFFQSHQVLKTHKIDPSFWSLLLIINVLDIDFC
jgi:hypothetical protein